MRIYADGEYVFNLDNVSWARCCDGLWTVYFVGADQPTRLSHYDSTAFSWAVREAEKERTGRLPER